MEKKKLDGKPRFKLLIYSSKDFDLLLLDKKVPYKSKLKEKHFNFLTYSWNNVTFKKLTKNGKRQLSI